MTYITSEEHAFLDEKTLPKVCMYLGLNALDLIFSFDCLRLAMCHFRRKIIISQFPDSGYTR